MWGIIWQRCDLANPLPVIVYCLLFAAVSICLKVFRTQIACAGSVYEVCLASTTLKSSYEGMGRSQVVAVGCVDDNVGIGSFFGEKLYII